ncbi:MAG: transcription-repair coupling factor [Acidobacteria bacterium]|nr:transcription-repair coupling factor [Acidobacteriota bacterium]
MLDFLRTTDAYRSLIENVRTGGRGIRLSGIIEPAKPYVLAFLALETGRPLVFIRPSTASLDGFAEQCRLYLDLLTPKLSPNRAENGANRSAAVPSVRVLRALSESPYRDIPPSLETASSRLDYLFHLLHNPPALTVTTPAGLLKRLPSPSELRVSYVELSGGDVYDRDRLLAILAEYGYSRQDLVNSPGEYAWRGGIVDVFSPWEERPFRLEFRGDRVGSLRVFDPSSQRTQSHLDAVLVPSLQEFPNNPLFHAEWGKKALQTAHRTFLRDIESKMECLRSGEGFPTFAYNALLLPDYFTSFDSYLEDPLYICDDAETTAADWEDTLSDHREQFQELQDQRIFALPPDDMFVLPLWEKIQQSAVRLTELEGADIPFDFVSVSRFNNRIPFFIETLRKQKENSDVCSIFLARDGMRRKLSALLAEEHIPHAAVDDPFAFPADGAVHLLLGGFRQGWSFPSAKYVLYAEPDIFTEERVLVRRSRIRPFTSHFQDLQAGDYIVHTDYGIGLFKGLVKMPVDGHEQEFMQLVYADDDKLFVPVEDMNLIQKYAQVGTTTPVLNKLGTPQWEKTKAKTKKAVQELARELLELYARRKALSGHSFSSGGMWYEDFEKTFEFDETEDQLTAIGEISADMESHSPMDRLLVGDVGYGKTEVAMRAAFRAVMDGRQVAVLCPTTVLASQHLKTFRRRMVLHPLRIEGLTRLQTRARQTKIVEDTRSGQVDILIGTHRILSADIGFRNLGLLVVDEEQRFGVKHKERLKQMKANIDVLTLTATPIPRTLNMSLSGLRDISLIETPPKDRLAIHTVVTTFDQKLITRAVRSELGRGGQVYFIHNKVDDIASIAQKISEWVPEANPIVVHGQMSGAELEKRMLAFIRRDYNMLVSTTIIENGIDIPLVNTLIVNRADRFGLAQLYQLRGRVGRSSRQAAAYFLVPPFNELSPLAKLRLKALKEFSALGSGFRLAAKDLEIRGAGHFLGARQHGTMEAVGYDYYMQLLERTVKELKGEAEEEIKTRINLKVDIKIPEDYLPQINLRLNLYKRVSSAENMEDIGHTHAEVEDRYGPLPSGVKNLLRYGIVRFLAGRLKIRGIDRIGSRLVFDFYPQSRADLSRLPDLLQKYRGTMTPQGVMSLNLSGTGEANILDETIFILKELSDM